MMTVPNDPVPLHQANASAAGGEVPAVARVSDAPATGVRGLLQRFWYVPVLVVYAAMVALAAVHHEPWIDEA